MSAASLSSRRTESTRSLSLSFARPPDPATTPVSSAPPNSVNSNFGGAFRRSGRDYENGPMRTAARQVRETRPGGNSPRRNPQLRRLRQRRTAGSRAAALSKPPRFSIAGSSRGCNEAFVVQKSADRCSESPAAYVAVRVDSPIDVGFATERGFVRRRRDRSSGIVPNGHGTGFYRIVPPARPV